MVRAPRRHRRDRADPDRRPDVLPYKGLPSYYDIGESSGAAWSYPEAWPEVARIGNLVSFEPDKIDAYLEGKKLRLEPGQAVIAHGVDRGLDPDEVLHRV